MVPIQALTHAKYVTLPAKHALLYHNALVALQDHTYLMKNVLVNALLHIILTTTAIANPVGSAKSALT